MLPRKLSKLLRKLRKVQISEDRKIEFDGFFIFRTVGRERDEIREFETDDPSLLSHLDYLAKQGLIVSYGDQYEVFQLTTDGWHYGEINRRTVWNTFLKSVLCPIVVSVLSTLATMAITYLLTT